MMPRLSRGRQATPRFVGKSVIGGGTLPHASPHLRADLIRAGLVIPREDRLTVQSHVLPSPVLRCDLQWQHEVVRSQKVVE